MGKPLSMPYHHDDEEVSETVVVPIGRLLEFGNPLTMDPWGVGVTEEMVAECLFEGRLLGPKPIHPSCPDPMEHAARIAWLVREGWSDPVIFDAGMPSLYIPQARWPFLDGNHRLAAAIYRGDEHILVAIDGDIEHGMILLLEEAPEPELEPC